MEAGCNIGPPDDLKPVLLYSGSLRLLLELASYFPLGQLEVTILEPCVPAKGNGANALKQVLMHVWVMLCHKIDPILWNYCMLCWKCLNWSGNNMDP